VITTREAFLRRVRIAVEAGNRSGSVSAVGPRGGAGYQGAGSDPVGRFCAELTAAGGFPYPVDDRPSAIAKTLDLIRQRSPRRALLGRGGFIDSLELRNELAACDIEVVDIDKLTVSNSRDALFAADVSITGVDYLIAETGSLICVTRADDARSLSLLPPVHIVVADRSQLWPDLFDLFERLPDPQSGMPSCVAIITGPSKTGDIELRLVTGVHGPGEVHVVLVTR